MQAEKLRVRFMGEMAVGMLLSVFSGLVVSVLLAGFVLILPSPADAGEGLIRNSGVLLTINQLQHGKHVVSDSVNHTGNFTGKHSNPALIQRMNAMHLYNYVFPARLMRHRNLLEDI